MDEKMLEQLRGAYSDFASRRPPAGWSDPTVDDLLDELVMYDADVAGAVERLTTKKPRPVPPEFQRLLEGNVDLRSRIEQRLSDPAKASARAPLAQARAHLDLIDRMLITARGVQLALP